MYGDTYGQFGHLLQWFAAAYILKFLSLPIRAGLRALECTQGIFRAQLYMATFNLVSVYPLVKFIGLTGACVGIVVGNIIVITALTFDMRNQLRHTEVPK